MSKGEFSSGIIKIESYSDDVHSINDKVKVEKIFLDEAKPEFNLVFIKKDMKEECLMEVKQEDLIIKDEISSSSDTQNYLTDDNIAFTLDIKPSLTSFNTTSETSISTGEKRFACCTLCQFKTSRKQAIKQHISHHTGTGCAKFRCAKFEYETSRQRNLVQRMVVHTGESQFACNLCEFKTTCKSLLHNHYIIKHTGNIGEVTSTGTDLTVRKRISVNLKLPQVSSKFTIATKNEKPFECNFCEFKTAQKHNLKSHMMKHTGEKPFACNLCEFKTITTTNLTIHKRIHTGEKPFACSICEFKSAHKSSLKGHMLIHTGEKPFACNLCKFKTAHKNNLKVHMMKHIDEKTFTSNLYELKEDINEESFMEVKLEEVFIKNEIVDTENYLTDDNAEFTV